MTIDEASKVIQYLLIKTEPLTETQLGWLETWIHKKDIEGFRVAIETMRKYQKIKEQVDIAIDIENFAISGARLIQIREIINGQN